MKTIILTVFFSLATLMVAGFGQANGTAANQHAEPATPVAAPASEALLALEKRSTEAFIQGDAKFFERSLSDKFVMYGGGQRMDKTAVLKMIAGNKCDVSGWQLEDPQIGKIDTDTYVVSHRATFAGSCTGPDGKSRQLPSAVRAATVWFRSGGQWMAAFHGENPLADPNQAPPPAEAKGKSSDTQKEAAETAANSNSAATKQGESKATPAAGPSTDAMMAVETSVWEAWMAKDIKRLEELTAKDLAFQNIFGTFFANRAETLKDWTGPQCDIKSISVTDGAGVLLSATVGLLTRTGTAEGTCAGQELARVPVYGASVFVKDGDAWKLAFSLNQL